jgi:hypothetical protein
MLRQIVYACPGNRLFPVPVPGQLDYFGAIRCNGFVAIHTYGNRRYTGLQSHLSILMAMIAFQSDIGQMLLVTERDRLIRCVAVRAPQTSQQNDYQNEYQKIASDE